MATFPYNIGESGELGFPLDQYDGTPMPLDGLGLRLVVHLPTTQIIVPGRATSGEVVMPGASAPVDHPSIAAFDITPDVFPQRVGLFPCVVQINDGTGWRVRSRHFINIRRA